VFGEEVEVGRFGHLVDVVGVPQSVFELYDRVFDEQGHRHVQFHLHLVLETHEQFAVLVGIAELLGYFLDVEHFGFGGYDVVNDLFGFVVLVGGADFGEDVDVLHQVVRVEI
jgi:hypothetical protein